MLCQATVKDALLLVRASESSARQSLTADLEAAGVLKDSCRQSDILARLGGDEFAILIADVAGDCADVVHRHIQQKLESCNSGPGRRYPLSFSAGIVEPTSFEYLLQQADSLMYTEKRKKEGRTRTRQPRVSAR